MDTETGRIVNLNELEAQKAQMEWAAWEAGLLKEMPQYAPVRNGDKIPVLPKPYRKQKSKHTKVSRSYKDFCR